MRNAVISGQWSVVSGQWLRLAQKSFLSDKSFVSFQPEPQKE